MATDRKTYRPFLEAMDARCLLSAEAGAIVTGLYREVLLRDPGAPELARYSDLIDRGASAQVVAARLYNSAEFRAEAVESYYEEILEREPAPDETDHWARVLAAGVPESRVEASIAGSPEAYARFGGDARDYVRSLFVSLVGRQASAAEITSYSGRIAAGASPSRIAWRITTTDDYRAGKVGEVFQVVLDRPPTATEARALAARWGAAGGLRGISLRLLGGAENQARLRSGLVEAPDLAAIDELRQILLAPYTEAADGFVNTYNRLLGTAPAEDAEGDPIPSPPANSALWQLTKEGLADGLPIDEARVITRLDVPVLQLTPLQSEIDLDKSLGFALGQAPADSDLEKYLAGGVIAPFGGPIVTGADGQFIVDGHHRWSSIYVINPDAAIEAVDLGHEVAPQNYLKVTQMAIGAELGYLQVQTVEGQNLFTIGQDDFEAWVKATITGGEDPRGVLDVFQRLRGLDSLQAVADFLWGNVESLRAHNLPLPGVTSRDYMPQPPADGLGSLLAWFESGRLNSRFPIVARLG